MIVTRRCAQPKISTEKRSTKLGNQLFHRIGFIAKATGEIAIQTGLRTRPVHEFMTDVTAGAKVGQWSGGVVSFAPE